MDAETRSAIAGLTARLEMDVLRLHLKIRRHTKPLEARIKELEQRIKELEQRTATGELANAVDADGDGHGEK